MVPHLIVFSERDFQGRHWHVFQDIPDIGNISFTWDDNISSFVVLAGQWQFYRDRQFRSPVGEPCGPGRYGALKEVGIPDDAVSSIQVVS